ncbi:MAG: molybdenum cofactor biosynthesis protein C [Candidatus Muproteobacteria bacterium RBG_16_62_13]|uniref:Cyclic pyranopterin monophosphate synthase n=1 Tax=Candidatus Muproteobacteria bacterium RBG_16_62_13 TaxID=1817756 RepID=A0A1F6T7Y4_9PROT|nr:MAG: molybdenum cofactor biosynthesis protein C [Candidatus Muproteobacteria bacterium RBG_16_62_13]
MSTRRIKKKQTRILTHLNRRGEAHMVDVGAKAVTAREAVAEGAIRMHAETLRLVMRGGHKKGDVLATARLAGMQAAKKTADLIPLCHPIPVTGIDIDLIPEKTRARIRVRVTARTLAQTGVEMEALTAASVALLTIYDMCKAVDRAMTIANVRLLAKSGGRSGTWRRAARRR